MAKQQSGGDLRVDGKKVKPEVARACALIGLPVTQAPRRSTKRKSGTGKQK